MKRTIKKEKIVDTITTIAMGVATFAIVSGYIYAVLEGHIK